MRSCINKCNLSCILLCTTFLFCRACFTSPPAVTRLTVYCWLHIHTQLVRPVNLTHNLCSMFCAQTLIARDPVVTFERRSKVTRTYVQRNFLAYRRCHCYTTEKVMAIPYQNCDVTCVHKLRSCIKQMQSFMSGRFLFFSSELEHHVHISRVWGGLACFQGFPSRN